MKNSDTPITAHMEYNPDNNPVDYHLGLTKREHFAALAMQGMGGNCFSGGTSELIRAAFVSVAMADALLKALEAES